MKSNLGVTRWLVAPRAVVVQSGVIVLLLGVVVGQNAERLWHLLRLPAASPATASQAVAGTMAPATPGAAPAAEHAQGAALPDFTVVPERREPAGRALTETQLWITASSREQAKRGYSVLAVLRPGGSLVVERCRVQEAGSQSGCEVVLDQTIAIIGETRIDLGNGRSFNYSLVHRDGVEVLHLSLAEELELVPGTKARLLKHLKDPTEEPLIRGRWARTSPRQRVAQN